MSSAHQISKKEQSFFLFQRNLCGILGRNGKRRGCHFDPATGKVTTFVHIKKRPGDKRTCRQGVSLKVAAFSQLPRTLIQWSQTHEGSVDGTEAVAIRIRLWLWCELPAGRG